MADRWTKTSRFLSLVLRHEPGKIDLSLDEAGWAPVAELLERLGRHGHPLTPDELRQVVEGNDKKRFAFSEDGQRIRASQGHSVSVDLGYEPAEPPAVLYHGTVGSALASVREEGITRQQRHHAHLSATPDAARLVGQRRGKPVVLEVDAAAMRRGGHAFFRSTNGVWLTDRVPPEFIRFPG